MAALPAELTDENGQAVTAVLFGDAQIVRPVQMETDRPTLAIYNRGGAPINLRNGAGVNFELVGQLGGNGLLICTLDNV